jgi:hypothetical protein
MKGGKLAERNSFVWQPQYSVEDGNWYCQKLIYMCPAEIHGEFKTEDEAIKECEKLNKVKAIKL